MHRILAGRQADYLPPSNRSLFLVSDHRLAPLSYGKWIYRSGHHEVANPPSKSARSRYPRPHLAVTANGLFGRRLSHQNNGLLTYVSLPENLRRIGPFTLSTLPPVFFDFHHLSNSLAPKTGTPAIVQQAAERRLLPDRSASARPSVRTFFLPSIILACNVSLQHREVDCPADSPESIR